MPKQGTVGDYDDNKHNNHQQSLMAGHANLLQTNQSILFSYDVGSSPGFAHSLFSNTVVHFHNGKDVIYILLYFITQSTIFCVTIYG